MLKTNPNPEGFNRTSHMSDMFSPNGKVTPIALAISDVHLSHKPPVWRSCEPDWYAAQRRVFDEINELANNLENDNEINPPLLVAGDLFHKWNSPPKLINFAIDQFKRFDTIAIPGQHDLPNHLDDGMEMSPYETLIKAGAICDVDKRSQEIPMSFKYTVVGYGWNTREVIRKDNNHIALVHQYVWMEQCSFRGAPNTRNVKPVAEALGKPKLIISGDNHIPFWHRPTRIYNCGSLMRLNRNQLNHLPRVGIIYSDYSVIPYYLETHRDKYMNISDVNKLVDDAIDRDNVDEFLAELATMGRGGLDFLVAVRRYVDRAGVQKATKRLIEMIMSGE
jgi:hypothetical protein